MQPEPPLKILLTGADGFLGVNLLNELLDRGYTVNTLVEKSRGKRIANIPNINIFFGDLLNPDTIEAAAKGCDAIIHTAACTDMWPSRSEMICAINYQGTKNIVDIALKQKIKRLVHVGTANSFGFGSNGTIGNESTPYSAAKYKLDYLDSKYQAQQMVLDAVKTKNLPAVIVNPTFMFGPNDSKPGAGAMILAVHKRKLPGYTTGGRNFAYVKDVATAIANALTMGRTGECYIVGNSNLTYQEIFGIIAKITNSKPPKTKLRPFFVKAYGLIGTLSGIITRKAPAVSYPMASISCDKHFYSSKKAIKELNLPQTDIELAIKEAFQWLVDNKYV
jgi:dihydroflavonol-4-reductase